jgi:hypothetical protein
MAGKYGAASFTVAVDDGPGGTARTVTSHILSTSGHKLSSVLEIATAFGVSFEASLPVGLKKVDPLTLEGFWDTTATTGPHVVFGDPDDGPQDSTRTVTFGYGDSKTFAGEAYLESYEVMPSVGALTRFRAVLQPTGTWAWA